MDYAPSAYSQPTLIVLLEHSERTYEEWHLFCRFVVVIILSFSRSLCTSWYLQSQSECEYLFWDCWLLYSESQLIGVQCRT